MSTLPNSIKTGHIASTRLALTPVLSVKVALPLDSNDIAGRDLAGTCVGYHGN